MLRQAVVLGLLLLVPSVPASAQAGEILKLAGVKGGFVVHLGCGDGKLTAALHASDAYLVQGLEADAAKVEQARALLREQGLYGPVTVEPWTSDRLPYADGIVNLVVAEDLGKVFLDDLMRVLAPGGVALVRKDGQWVKTVKPRPKEIDEWTHYLHDPSNNAVAHDSVVGPPRRLQWVGSPNWSRHHDHMASTSAMVTSGGRVFYIFDEGPLDSIELPSKWTLIARDAFSGVVLWKRPIAEWHPTQYPFKSGPAYLPRRLVAVGERVYVTLGLDAPVTCLDAATGETLLTYEGTKSAEDILCIGGMLLVVAGDAPRDWSGFKQESHDVRLEKPRVAEAYPWDAKPRRLMAIDAATGQLAWQKSYAVSPLTLAADAGRVYFHDGEKLVALKRADGSELWRSEPVKQMSPLPTCFASTLVVYEDVVLFSGVTNRESAFSAETGKKLWEAPHPPSGHNSPEDLLVVGGLAWAGDVAKPEGNGVFQGRDLHTGEVKVEFPPDVTTYWFHHRCYRSKAVGDYILPSRTGIEFVNTRTKQWTTNHWVRGGCIYGVMPANGMIYTPPHSCACYIESKLNGLCALAPEAEHPIEALPDDARLEKGPAYADTPDGAEAAGDWPTYRHDAARSGCTKSSVPAEVSPAWETEIGGKISSPVLAEGRIFVASVETHAVQALSAADGKKLWSYTAGARVDSPPTIWRGRAIFGCRDGWVYCLRASDGALAWRFHAAPAERSIVAREQVESSWPVNGSVLVLNDAVWCVAGRDMFVDGGLRLLELDPRTGKKLAEKVLDDKDPATGKNLQSLIKNLNMPVAMPDILSSDGKSIYMRSQQFDLSGERRQVEPMNPQQQVGEGRHLFSPTGFLDDGWFHRAYWVWGRAFNSGPQQWYRVGHQTPAGGIMVFDPDESGWVYALGRRPQYYRWTTPVEYQLYAAQKDAKGVKSTDPKEVAYGPGDGLMDTNSQSVVPTQWRGDVPVLARAMALAGGTLFVAGPARVVDEEEAFAGQGEAAMKAKLAEQLDALGGAKGGLLVAVSAKDGKPLGEIKLPASPVFDGLIASGGRLYMSTKTGRVLCLSGK